jgi:hypothetical protein
MREIGRERYRVRERDREMGIGRERLKERESDDNPITCLYLTPIPPQPFGAYLSLSLSASLLERREEPHYLPAPRGSVLTLRDRRR